MTPLAIDAALFSRIQLILDASLKSSSELFAVRAFASNATVFLKGSDIVTYLSAFETPDVKINEIDFTQLKNEAPAVAPAVKAPAGGAPKQAGVKEEAMVDGAIQIGILYKKEVDFAGWYTDVSVTIFHVSNMSRCIIGPFESRDDGLLQC